MEMVCGLLKYAEHAAFYVQTFFHTRTNAEMQQQTTERVQNGDENGECKKMN